MKKQQRSKYGNHLRKEVVDDKKFRVAIHPKTDQVVISEGSLPGFRAAPAVAQYVDTVTTQGKSHAQVALIADALLW